MADQDVPHRLSRYRQEMSPRLPLDAVKLDELQVRLVNEAGGVERVSLPLVAEFSPGDLAELPVDQGHKLVHRFAVAVAE
jgi:hypothetical protein